MNETVFLLCVLLIVQTLVLALCLLSVPVLLWRVLRQADQLAQLTSDVDKLRENVDKVDVVLDGMMSGGRVEA